MYVVVVVVFVCFFNVGSFVEFSFDFRSLKLIHMKKWNINVMKDPPDGVKCYKGCLEGDDLIEFKKLIAEK